MGDGKLLEMNKEVLEQMQNEMSRLQRITQQKEEMLMKV